MADDFRKAAAKVAKRIQDASAKSGKPISTHEARKQANQIAKRVINKYNR